MLIVAVEVAACLACVGLGIPIGRRMMAGKVAAHKERTQNLAALLAQEKIACDRWQVKAEDLLEVNGLLTEAAAQRDFFKSKATELEAKWHRAFKRERKPNGKFLPREKPDKPFIVAGI